MSDKTIALCRGRCFHRNKWVSHTDDPLSCPTGPRHFTLQRIVAIQRSWSCWSKRVRGKDPPENLSSDKMFLSLRCHTILQSFHAISNSTNSPLHWSFTLFTDHGSYGILAGTSTEVKDEDGLTPLHYAAMCEHLEVRME